MTDQPPVEVVPPPWTLRGSGYAIFYHFSSTFAQTNGFVPPALDGMFLGGTGAIMLLDYRESPVGPYRELLFTPGQFAAGRKKAHCVTKIYVDSAASQASGRANWGLLKERADFTIQRNGSTEIFRVAIDGSPLFEVAFRPGRLSVPVPSWLVRPRIVQPGESGLCVTRLKAGGRVRLADVAQPEVNGDLFPNVHTARPIGVIRLDRFTLTMPAAHPAD